MLRSYFRTPISFFVLLSPFLFQFARCQEQSRELSDEEILPIAINAITGNYSKLTTIRAKLYSVLLDPKVDRMQTKQLPVEGGGTVTLTESPRVANRVYFTSKGRNYRYERRGQAVWVCKDGTLTQHIFATKNTQSWPLTHSPGFVEMDPRTLGGRGVNCGLVDQLKECRVISSDFRDGGVVEIEAEIIAAVKIGHPGARYRYTLDRERNWLPIRIISLREDGLIGVVTDFEYNEVLPKTWFMKQVTTNYAGSYEIREISPDVQWSQTHLVYTFGQPEFNVSVSDAELTSLVPIENRHIR